MTKYLLLLLLTGCLAVKEPIEVTESLIKLERIEVKYRGSGDIAFLYWYNTLDKQMYLQAISACDTFKYKQGMYRVEFITR